LSKTNPSSSKIILTLGKAPITVLPRATRPQAGPADWHAYDKATATHSWLQSAVPCSLSSLAACRYRS